MKKELFKKVIEEMLQRGASYAEVFYQHAISENIGSVDNKRFAPSFSDVQGYSLRAFKNGTVFFESTNDGSEENLLRIAKSMLGEKQKEVSFDFTSVKEFSGEWYEALDLEKAKSLVNNIVAKILNFGKRITNASAYFSTSNDFRIIASSEGNYVEFPTYISTYGFEPVAKEGDQQQGLGKKISMGMNWKRFIAHIEQNWNEDKLVAEACEKSDQLLDAPFIEGGDMPVILPSGFGAVLFHEAVGHPLEASAVAKGLSTYADKMGQQVASNLVTLIDDGTLVDQRGSAEFDDEGQPQQRRVLIEKGILKQFLVDKYNGDLMGAKANGASRRQGYGYIPTSRMSNTFILNGSSTVEEIIKNTKYGFYAKSLGGGQVDPFSGQFNFGVTEGYLIKDGAIAHLVKPATLIGNGIEALLKVDMVADDFALGDGTCGASSGMIPVTVGQPTLRISKMTVGGK